MNTKGTGIEPDNGTILAITLSFVDGLPDEASKYDVWVEIGYIIAKNKVSLRCLLCDYRGLPWSAPQPNCPKFEYKIWCRFGKCL